MSPYPGSIAPLDWPGLVAEAMRLRKAEGLTQREHAALARVSIPTIVAFDRAETTLSLAKALDILRVVGLTVEDRVADLRDGFVAEAFARWQSLTATLPPDSPGRFPHGWYRVDYALEGALKPVTARQLLTMLRAAGQGLPQGWPPFHVFSSDELEPYEMDDVLECWLRPNEMGIRRFDTGPAFCDFWRASPSGRLVLLRGYDEDGQPTFPPGIIFDTVLPIWRLGEVLLHAARMAELLTVTPAGTTVRFRAHYTGLAGRELRNWANPIGGPSAITGQRARGDEAVLERAMPAATIDAELDVHVHALVASLYERFGVAALSREFVASELAKLQGR